jgi:ABC-type Fe3+ transport system permease subunit
MIHSTRRREKMPQTFKSLVTVTTWLMFIFAWLFLIVGLIAGGFVGGELTGDVPPSMNFMAGIAVSIGFAFAGGFLMLVRKKLE